MDASSILYILLSFAFLFAIVLTAIIMLLKMAHVQLNDEEKEDSLYTNLLQFIHTIVPINKLRSRNSRASLFVYIVFFVGGFMLGTFLDYFIVVWITTGFVMFLGSSFLLKKRSVPNSEFWDTYWDDESFLTYVYGTLIMCLIGPMSLVPILIGISETNDSLVGT